MRQKLFTVEDTFQITGRGIVAVGERESDCPEFKIGSSVVLVRPGGKESVTKIFGIEHIKPIDYENFNRNRVGVMFENINSKNDVPIGAEVFLEQK